jgi:CubicO group peptidase (beta-lactamase class C family)
MGDGVERPAPDPASGGGIGGPAGSAEHLGGGASGEGEQEDALGLDPPPEEGGDPGRQRLRLAGPGAGHDEQRTVAMVDDPPLGGVQVVEGGRHPARLYEHTFDRRRRGLGQDRAVLTDAAPVRTALLALLATAGLLVGASPAAAAPQPGRDLFGGVDRAMRARLRGQRGGAVLIARDRVTVHQRSFGAFRATTVLPIASASKWLTAATVLTLVDEGRLSLDAPVAGVLPEFGGDKAGITLRMLLSHRSGLPDAGCVADPILSLTACVHSIAQSQPEHPPGQFFHYSSVGFEVAARVIEVTTGTTFERAFEDRIGKPVGMTHTRFDVLDGRHTRNPDAAAGATSTVNDYARYLDMVLHLGLAGATRVLMPASVLEMERDQVAGVDTTDDVAVHITKIPTYGLGVWRDLPGPAGVGVIVSGSGALGFYPWVDRQITAYGIVAVDDERGPEQAVPASQRVARTEWTVAAFAP